MTETDEAIAANEENEGGQHMIDSVDPNSVDFEPLMKSPNGAAITVPIQESDEMQNDGNHDSRWGPSSQSPSKTKDNTSKSFFFSWIPGILHLLPLKVALRLTGDSTMNASTLTSPELSITSSIAICSLFFATVVFAGMVSSAIASWTGITPPKSPSDPLQFSSRASQLRSYSDNKGLSLISPQGVGLAPPVGTSVPPIMREVFADVSDLPMELMDTAIFWHIPRSMGTTMKHSTVTCLGKVIATVSIETII
jgi:hypothetical protein